MRYGWIETAVELVREDAFFFEAGRRVIHKILCSFISGNDRTSEHDDTNTSLPVETKHSIHWSVTHCFSYVVLLIGIVCAAPVNAQSSGGSREEEPSTALAKTVCKFTYTNYQKAVRLAEKTREFRDIKILVNQKKDGRKIVYLGEIVDKPVLWRGTCYEKVTIYIDRPDHLELVLLYRIDTAHKKVFLQNLDGEFQQVMRLRAEANQ